MTDDFRPAPATGIDPRQERPAGSPTWDTDTRPVVATTPRGGGMWLIVGVSVLLGLLVLFWLGFRRTSEVPQASITTATDITAPQTPRDVASFEADSRAITAPQIASTPPVPTPAAPTTTTTSTTIVSSSLQPALLASAADARLKAPAMVVDLADPAPAASTSGSGAATSAGKGSAETGGARTPVQAGGPSGPTSLNGDEQFAARVGAEQPERAEATVLRNRSQTIPQGAMIPGVLETALDSDLPGYARAVVSREVRSFDGSTVLIPRGSRVIGQYKSAVALGQSRAFVIWTRILRPDGVSIQIGSSGTDPLGRAGLAGTVNRHFLEQFGGSILLSVIDAGVTSLVRQPSTEVVIGSASQATTLAGSAALPTAIPPTIKVPQGTPIRIFVARDLDFSSAQGADR